MASQLDKAAWRMNVVENWNGDCWGQQFNVSRTESASQWVRSEAGDISREQVTEGLIYHTKQYYLYPLGNRNN